ncbi:glycosidase [candidate division KSB1 bacterium]|nr:glycosidase [candidate division KSB1 bacterium]RQW03044.1 MAG: glycosidase [candidate division KSB1 bacterium]
MKRPIFLRHTLNPVIRPGLFDWRMAVTFNPGVIYEDGTFYLYERTAGGLRPFHCYIGLLESKDGLSFRHVSNEPVWTPEMAGSRFGSVQDPRIVKIDEIYYMTYAFRPYAWNCYPTGLGIPESSEAKYPGFSGDSKDNQTRSGIAISKDRMHWQHFCWPTPKEMDDRDVILFPEKINGQYVLLRRPQGYVGPDVKPGRAAMHICFSDNLLEWSEPQLLIEPQFSWEGQRIGGAAPPIKTSAGWLTLYHGVEEVHPPTRHVVYRVGAMLLDVQDPRQVIARSPHFVLEPETYYEKIGLYIPDVIFPTGAVVVDKDIYIYYGCCDTTIGLAIVNLEELVTYVMSFS